VPKPPLMALALARFHEARDVRRLEESFARRNSTCLTEGAAQSETIGHRSTIIPLANCTRETIQVLRDQSPNY
jgi:hypothetical protein